VLQFNWYVLVLILSALISAVLAIIAFRKIHAVGSPEMAGLMLSLTLWASAAAGGAACTSLIAKITWTVISYLGSQIVPVWFLLFIYTFTRQTRQFTLREKVALFFIPLITVSLAATNSYHGLLWSQVYLVRSPTLGMVAQFHHGPWFWVQLAYIYTVSGIGFITFLQAVGHYPFLSALYNRALLLAVLAPWLLSLLYVFRPESATTIDLAPIAFAWSGLWLFWAATRQGFLEFPSITREDMLERLHEGVLLFDAQNRLVEANLAARDFFHLTHSSKGKSDAEVFKNRPDIHSFLSQCRPACMEIMTPWPEIARQGAGSVEDSAAPLVLLLNLVPVENEAGKHLGSLITAIDVSEQRKIANALRASELRYRLLVENQGEGIVVVNSNEVFTFANPAAERIYGTQPGMLVGRSLLDFIPPDQKPILQEQITLCDLGEQGNYELEILRDDGSRRTLEVTARRQDMEQDYLRSSFAIVRDITERKQDERALLQSNTTLRDRERFLAMLNDITRTALEAANLDSMLQIIADKIGALYNADGCYITLWDEERRLAIPIAAFGREHDRYARDVYQSGENTLRESVLAAGHALTVEDVLHSRYISPSAVSGNTRSALGLPLIAGGRKLGAVLVGFDQPYHFTATEISMGEILAGQLALAVLKARLLDETITVNQKLQKALEALDLLATTDKLTSVYNRRKFDELIHYEFKRLDRYRHPVSLILFDIDQFKEINDVYGHHIGDEVLVDIAATVRKNIRQIDSLVRWGGDEFLILAPNTHVAQAVIIAEKLRAIVAQRPIGPISHMTVSMGVTELVPGESPEEPVRRADQALYLSKHNGRNQVKVMLPKL
jgi:diguanylate cyclase (GGDEF)-like protein/PAS domain S-box-containing protein